MEKDPNNNMYEAATMLSYLPCIKSIPPPTCLLGVGRVSKGRVLSKSFLM